jgi:hypothetical protein
MTAILKFFGGVSPATTLAERIGNVVQWTGNLVFTVPTILFVMDVGVALMRGYVLLEIVRMFVGATLIWLACRATNYILTGR